jgi:hypothetical protein
MTPSPHGGSEGDELSCRAARSPIPPVSIPVPKWSSKTKEPRHDYNPLFRFAAYNPAALAVEMPILQELILQIVTVMISVFYKKYPTKAF